jgi:hypothetical protein
MMSVMDLPSSKFAKVVTLGIQPYNDKYVPHIGCIILHPPPSTLVQELDEFESDGTSTLFNIRGGGSKG